MYSAASCYPKISGWRPCTQCGRAVALDRLLVHTDRSEERISPHPNCTQAPEISTVPNRGHHLSALGPANRLHNLSAGLHQSCEDLGRLRPLPGYQLDPLPGRLDYLQTAPRTMHPVDGLDLTSDAADGPHHQLTEVLTEATRTQ